MRILALETTERIGGVALAEGGRLVLQTQLPDELRSAQSLAPAIQQSLAQVGWTPRDVQLVAVTTGPGSFTGLRIGITTAKTFAYAVGAEVLGVGTHEALAWPCPADVSRLATVIDAQRGQVVGQMFCRGGSGELVAETGSELLDVDGWLAALTAGTAVTGPVLPRLAGRLPDGCLPLRRELWCPSAGSVALLAHRDHARGRRDDLWHLSPVYSRPSAAEEKRRAR
ncbi:MAG: tRNA (adenosine(37)-N6)-threonylcarbamoyltransferase complex dimerization subunit type 1 TsaB [Thermoguttaceae bacterium]